MPISDEESEIALFQQQDEGVAAYANIGGFEGSSTRTEVAAGSIAIYAHGPIHIGTDSQAFAKKANKLTKDIDENKDDRNWALESDGDLWDLFHKALKAKNTKAIKITWIKGHATEKMVEQGVTTQANRKGNMKADEIADIGTKLFTKEVIEMAEKYHARYEKYVSFMQKVATHLVEAYMLHRKLLNYYEDSKQSEDAKCTHGAPKHGDHYETLWTPQDEHTKHVEVNATLGNFQNFQKANKNSLAMQSFLHGIKIQTEGQERNTTWFEIYILYRLRGYSKPIPNPAEPRTKPTLDKQMCAFKNELRRVCSKLAGNKEFLKPGKPAKNTLSGIGILGKYAGPNFAVLVSEQEKQQIEFAMHKLNHACTYKKWQKIQTGDDSFVSRIIRLRGKTQWDDDLPTLSGPTFQISRWDNIGKLSDRVDRNGIFFTCPKCSKLDTPQTIGINDQNLDQKLRCKHCSKTTFCSDWLCPCSCSWFMCKT